MIEFTHDKLLINKKEFCEFCILLGSDYLTFNHGLKPNEILELIYKYKTIENIHEQKIISCITNESFILIDKIRNIYYNSDLLEKNFIVGKNIDNNTNINLLIDHSNISFYSNVMLEFWDDFINILNKNNNENDDEIYEIKNLSDDFKYNIYKYISNKKFNIKNILKFIKNNIKDITEEEITNMIISFDFLNTFGI